MTRDSVINEIWEHFRARFGRYPAWTTVMVWTITALNAENRSGLTAEQKKDVQERLGILN